MISNKDLYKYVPWPESQDYMEEPWFEKEAILDSENAACYFIPLNRLGESKAQMYFSYTFIADLANKHPNDQDLGSILRKLLK